jgi:hypothetical protein
MVNADEELKAAKAAKTAINGLPLAAPKKDIFETLRKAYRIAVLNLSEDGPLNDARGVAGIALSNLIPLTQAKLDNAKAAIEDWLKLLQEGGAGRHP